jgi:TonB family protein
MRSMWQLILVLLVTPLLLAQDSPPTSTPPSNLSGCDSILKRTSPHVSGGHLVHGIMPKYPKAARHAQLQGSVRLSATITKDGSVKDVIVIEGDPILAAAAAEAVERWRYGPYTVNDAPVEVPNAITVNFKLDGRVEASQNITAPAPSNGAPAKSASATPVAKGTLPYPVYEIGSDIKSPKEIFAPNPPYAESARKAKVQGNVVLGLVVTPEGSTGDIEVCRSLDAALDQKAIEAVGQWKFEPATKDGKPVAVHVRIDVSFHLNQ